MIIAPDVKIVPRAIALFAYNIFSTIEQKKKPRKKNNDKQHFSPVRRV
jgi:hypothetical protein